MKYFNENDLENMAKGIGTLCGTAGLIRENMILAGFEERDAIEASIRFLLNAFNLAAGGIDPNSKKDDQ